MKIQTRSLNNMVEEQLKKWQVESKERKTVKAKPGPVITISREPGSGGSEIARKLSEDLKMDLVGAQIIQKIAESADMSTKVIESLDEKEITRRDNWLTALFETRHLWEDTYLFHLTKVIGTFGRQGNVIIVGRGAQYILPPEDTFRLRFVAPMEIKIQNVMRDFGSTRQEAEKYIIKTDSDRRAYLRKYFNADVTNPSDYDMVINTGKLGIDSTVDVVKVAFNAWKKRRAAIP
ncbi:MAG: cytidylate kinase-like family protein [Deltaproteobacteria bacterium]|nr:cytidylate kinase-like family protein [Deltaproteobacteria bacterium]